MHVDLGPVALDQPHQLEVPVELQLLGPDDSALQENLRAADRDKFLDLLADLVIVQNVPAVLIARY